MTPTVVGQAGASLAELEAQLGSLYSHIAAQYGLPIAMQALGRLMLSTPAPAAAFPPAAPPPPTASTAAAPSTAAPDAAAGLQPVPASPASALRLPATSQPSPFSATAASQPSPTSSPDHAADGPQNAAGNTLLAASQPIAIPPAAPAPTAALAHARTLESIRTVPSASLSELPSGVLSIVSPSAAGAASDLAEGDGPVSSSDLQMMTSPGAGEEPDDGGAATAAAARGAGGVRVKDASPAAAEAVAAVVAAKAAAAAAEGAGREGADMSESVMSMGSGVTRGTPRSGSLWQRAMNLSKAVADPWAGRNLHTLSMERAVRQRYNAMTGQWVTDEVLVKMEAKPFAAGAMRECYAAKKLSTFTHNVDWHKAQNMVAKRYKKEGVRKSVYYNDVLVQMDAKMLGEMYNKTDPPKQVDVMQCAILQFPGRAGRPLYAVEQLIEGDYVKYNSNSGFVKGDDLLRNTPQAFSHFTWVLTKGLKICVDIQGVGDLYTDPQLHTLDGEGYGEGNLGLRGMGLFFRSHECNALCCRLGLKPFNRCDADVRTQGYSSETSSASASATRPGPAGSRAATAARTIARTTSYKSRLAERRRRGQQALPQAWCAEEVQLAALRDVAKESPDALVHLEIAKLYGEIVLLPELRPNEDPEDALRGGLFHINSAAQAGSLLALMVLARAHCGLEATSPQLAHLFKVGTKQRQFQAHVAVAWRCTTLAAERGVRGAALALAATYGTGGGLFGEEVLGGTADPVQAARWYAAALALPDLLAEEEEGGAEVADAMGGVIHEGEEEVDEEGASGSGRGSSSDEDPTQFEMSVMRNGGGGGGHHRHHHHQNRGGQGADSEEEDDNPGHHVSGLSELDLGATPSLINLGGLRVPKLEELRPSKAFLARIKLSVEEEAAALPGAAAARYEVLYQYGSILLAGGPDLEPSPARAAELLEQAAEEAGGAGKGKLAQKYYELAAKAQAMCE